MISYLELPEESDGSFEAVVAYRGEPTTITFDIDESQLTELEIPLAHLLANSEAVHSEVASSIERELLPLYNDHWSSYTDGNGTEYERPEITLDEFLSTISLDGIDISDTLIDFWYDDGDLFHGHAVHVSARYTSTPAGITLESFTAGLD